MIKLPLTFKKACLKFLGYSPYAVKFSKTISHLSLGDYRYIYLPGRLVAAR